MTTGSTIANNIAFLLKQKNISQKELAEKTGTTEAAISRYLSGKRTPRLPQLMSIVSALECSILDLTDGCVIYDEQDKVNDAIDISVTPFITGCTPEEQVMKISEEVMELFGAVREQEKVGGGTNYLELTNEIADVIQATVNLAVIYQIDINSAMKRCTERQKERGWL